MIDTNKYEGHTPGPWEEGEYIPSDEMIERFRNRELQGAVMQQDSNLMLAMIGLDGDGEKDRLLMADAPLLLAEVKRLREQLMKAKKWVHYHCQAYTSAVSMMKNYEDYMTKDIPYWNHEHIEKYDEVIE